MGVVGAATSSRGVICPPIEVSLSPKCPPTKKQRFTAFRSGGGGRLQGRVMIKEDAGFKLKREAARSEWRMRFKLLTQAELMDHDGSSPAKYNRSPSPSAIIETRSRRGGETKGTPASKV